MTAREVPLAIEVRAYTLLRNVRLKIGRKEGSTEKASARKFFHFDFFKTGLQKLKMAIYHFSGSVISRSQGRSAVACASYRSAEILHDEKYHKTHDYSRKQDVISSEILLPTNAPEWMKDREKLWNAVEASERRKDAQLAREMQFSLPRELSNEENTLLAREFIQKNFVDKGMIADWAFHVDRTPSGEAQSHVHVMLTMREVSANGFGQKVREWNRKEELMQWREAWAENANRHLAMHGHDIQIDHRSNEEQGISLEAQYKIGTSVASDRMARQEDHQRIARENGEKIFSDPKIALDAITKQQSTFTHQDLARFIHRHTEDAEQFQQVYEKVKLSPEIIFLGKDDTGRERHTTQEMLALETRMLSNANKLIDEEGHRVQDKSKVQALETRSLSEQQRTAFEHLTDKGDIKCLVGYAGTGKSYLLGAAREAWEKEGFNVLGGTLSGIAAETLESSSGIESRTLASRMYYWDRGEQLLTSKDILVIDEAGMIGSRQMARLMAETQRHGAKVVLIGDPEQLQAIDAGGAFKAIIEQTGFAELTEIRRQKEEWQREATRELAMSKTTEAIARYKKHDHVHEFETQAMAKRAIVERWNDVRISETDKTDKGQKTEKTQIMLAYTRADVKDMNEMARALRHELGELREERTFQTERGERQFAENDRVYFLQNDRELGVKNGTLGTIERIDGNSFTVRLDKEGQENKDKKETQIVVFDIDKYKQLDHGYAATIHKSQGVTVDRAYLLASRYMDRHAAYVGMSRHRESADLFYSREEFKSERDLVQALGRDRGKDISLDYGENGKLGEFVERSERSERGKEHEIGAQKKEKENYGRNRGIEVIEVSDRIQKSLDQHSVYDEYLNEANAKDRVSDQEKKEKQEKQLSDISHSDSARTREESLKSLAAFKERYDAKRDGLESKQKSLLLGDQAQKSLEGRESRERQLESSLDAFRARYAKENPDKANMFKEMVNSSEEKALSVHVDRFEQLHRQLANGEVTKKEIEAYAVKMEKEPKMMEYLAYNHRGFHQEIRQIMREQERERERQLERSRSHNMCRSR